MIYFYKFFNTLQTGEKCNTVANFFLGTFVIVIYSSDAVSDTIAFLAVVIVLTLKGFSRMDFHFLWICDLFH